MWKIGPNLDRKRVEHDQTFYHITFSITQSAGEPFNSGIYTSPSISPVSEALPLDFFGVARVATEEEAQERWRAALHERRCLLVIDDVWKRRSMEPLLEGGPQCVRLITTRNDQVLPEDAARILVDTMKQEEALVVLSHDLPVQVQPSDWPKLEELVARLDCWPLLLNLARGMLVSHLGVRKTLGQALERLQQQYEKYGIVAFRLDDPNERQKAAAANLRVSLDYLAELMPAEYGDVSQRYHELAVFPEDTDIPLGIIQAYWSKQGRLKDWESDELCKELYRLSLLLTYDSQQSTVRLHGVFRDYLRHSVGASMPSLHAGLLDATQEMFDLARWAQHSSETQYLWQHIISHQEQAERPADTEQLLTDLRFLAGKAFYVDIPTLETDLLRAQKREQEQATKQGAVPFQPLQETIERFNAHLPRWMPSLPVKSESSRFELFYQTILHLSHLLRQAQNPADIGGILLSHLRGESVLAEQLLLLERTLLRPYLTAHHPLPRQSSATLSRTFSNMYPVRDCAVSTDGSIIVSADMFNILKIWDVESGTELLKLELPVAINCCAISPDGSWIVAGLADGTLKLLDSMTGENRKTLSGHTDTISCCAVSPQGDWIVSGSYDKTLKVWDVISGEERLTWRGHTESVMDCTISSPQWPITKRSEPACCG